MSQVTLESGGINPVKAKIRSEGQLETFSTIVDEFENVSARDSNSFSWTTVPYNSSDADTVLAVQNTHDTLQLHIVEIRIKSDASSVSCVVFTIDAAAAPSGTLVTGACWNRAAPKVAKAVAATDDTANTSQETIIADEELIADVPNIFDMHSAVVLGTNAMIGVDIGTGSTALCSARIIGFYAIPDSLRV